MLGYIIRRALYAVPILIGVCLATFLLFYVVVSPTQLARRNLSSKNPTRQEIQDWLQQHGYDRPLTVQFRDHMLNLALFRFGNSDYNNEPIGQKLRRGMGPSLRLAVIQTKAWNRFSRRCRSSPRTSVQGPKLPSVTIWPTARPSPWSITATGSPACTSPAM